jgi:hypothetical protein
MPVDTKEITTVGRELIQGKNKEGRKKNDASQNFEEEKTAT